MGAFHLFADMSVLLYERVSPLLEMGPALPFYQTPFVTFLFLSVLTAKMLRFVDGLGEDSSAEMASWPTIQCAAPPGTG